VPLDVRAGGREQNILKGYLVFKTFLSSEFVLNSHLISTLVTKAIAVASRRYWISRQVNCNRTITESQNHRITKSQNGRGWKGPLGII